MDNTDPFRTGTKGRHCLMSMRMKKMNNGERRKKKKIIIRAHKGPVIRIVFGCKLSLIRRISKIIRYKMDNV